MGWRWDRHRKLRLGWIAINAGGNCSGGGLVSRPGRLVGSGRFGAADAEEERGMEVNIIMEIAGAPAGGGRGPGIGGLEGEVGAPGRGT